MRIEVEDLNPFVNFLKYWKSISSTWASNSNK